MPKLICLLPHHISTLIEERYDNFTSLERNLYNAANLSKKFTQEIYEAIYTPKSIKKMVQFLRELSKNESQEIMVVDSCNTDSLCALCDNLKKKCIEKIGLRDWDKKLCLVYDVHVGDKMNVECLFKKFHL